MILKAKVESSSSYLGVKRLVSGAFNVGLIGSTCTALPMASVIVYVKLCSFVFAPVGSCMAGIVHCILVDATVTTGV